MIYRQQGIYSVVDDQVTISVLVYLDEVVVGDQADAYIASLEFQGTPQVSPYLQRKHGFVHFQYAS
jgi:hypothetical protein